MNHKLMLLMIVGAAITLSACSGESAPDPLAAGNPERGREIFEDGNRMRCESCHTLDGSDRRGGPSLLGVSERAAERIPELSAVEYPEQSILDPSAFVVEGFEDKMKLYKLVERSEGDFWVPLTLTQEDLNDLVAFLLTQ